jgi:hypothetical protein
VRTNLLLQSNTFSTTWTNFNTTDTGGQSGYGGTNDAWLLQNTAASGSIRQTISASGVQTYSFYAKAGTTDWVAAYVATSGAIPYCFFDLTNGVKGATQNNVINSSITAVGGGWYRIAIAFNTTTTDVRIFPAEANAVLASQVGDNIYIQDAQLETGDIATDYIATTTAAVSVGPVANVPRLDYLDSSSPRLLLEPQRTNLITFSEQFDNAGWTKLGITVAANNTTSPSGYIDADKLIADAGTGNRVVYQGVIPVGVSTTTVYAKAGEFGGIVIASGTQGGFFDLTTGAYRTEYNSAPTAYNITSASNGWYRCSVTMTSVSGDNLYIGPNDNVSTSLSLTGDGTSGMYAWGAQLEAGAYETSYIPTLGAAVTRGADAASKTGISSLIGQTEGTVLLDFNLFVSGDSFQSFLIGNGTQRVYFFLLQIHQ